MKSENNEISGFSGISSLLNAIICCMLLTYFLKKQEVWTGHINRFAPFLKLINRIIKYN